MKNTPAFPQHPVFDVTEHVENAGMTLRDYFAAHCMADVLAAMNWTDGDIAKGAALVWKLADAMLAARDK